MKNFTSVHDIKNLKGILSKALAIKQDPFSNKSLGQNKTLGLVFLNPSLRTRLSSQQAGWNLGMHVQVLNAGQDAWTWEFSEGTVMDGSTTEHVKEAARVLSRYCDVIGIRAFPLLQDREEDYSEPVLSAFLKYATVPVVSLESATRHPLQSFADLITIKQTWKEARPPKVVLTWAPHTKALPHCVANSFSEWMIKADVDFSIANPIGYDLSPEFVQDTPVYHDQMEALKDADYVYVKNWSSFEQYGAMPPVEKDWMLGEDFLLKNPSARIMHCLPVRRNLELGDALLDSSNQLVYEQAANRTLAMQTVLSELLSPTL